jgi:acyl-coenzyme A thioesterase PaaI-like protein
MSTTKAPKAGPNRLARTLAQLDKVPAPLRPLVRNLVLRRAVPFTGTARLDFASLTPEKVEIGIANQRRVQNHIQGVHAAAMTLLAETATGMVVGMNVRDDCLPLAKELKVQFKRRTKGDMRAVAQLTAQQRQLMQTQDKGEVVVPVTVTDASGEEPIQCEFIWAWVPTAKKAGAAPKTHSVPA